MLDHVVIGGGFFGSQIAARLGRKSQRVLLLEKEPDLLGRASWFNQARVHGGYHYPRSLVTAARSQRSFARFIREFEDSIDFSFKHLYAIPQSFSKVSAKQFYSFCAHIGAPIQKMLHPPSWLNSRLIDGVFEVEEFAFDASALRAKMKRELGGALVRVELSSPCLSVSQRGETLICKTARGDFETKQVWMVNYASINDLLRASDLPLLNLRLEVAELCLISPPSWLKEYALTLMDGPFFSVMPFPAEKNHSVSHVRFTPRLQVDGSSSLEPSRNLKSSHWRAMAQDISRYLPSFSEDCYLKSFYETKALLPQSERSDSRPILYRRDYGARGIHLVLGGKIDNVFDILDLSPELRLES